MQEHQSADKESEKRQQEDRLRNFLLRRENIGIAIAVWSFILGFFLLRLYIYDHIPTDPSRAAVLVESMFSLAIVIVIVVHAVMYQKQAKALDAQLAQTKRGLEIAERAYVCVHSVKLDLSNERMFIQLENLGRVPAFNIEALISMHCIIPAEFGIPSAHFRDTYMYGITHLFAGNLKVNIRIPLNLWLNTKQIETVKSGAAHLVLNGNIRFFDSFDFENPRDTPFAYRYRLSDQEWFPQRLMMSDEEAKQKSEKDEHN